MNSDLSNVKAGDWVWTIRNGWTKVNAICKAYTYPIMINNCAYNIEGKDFTENKFPSAFLVPPEGFGAGDPPREFKHMDKVLVGSTPEEEYRRYFHHYDSQSKQYYCYSDGMDEWTSYGRDLTHWARCRKWEG